MRLAAKVYYDGTAFYGSQRQPDRRTVEGELLRALRSLGEVRNFKSAGRTDRFVSALGNVFAFDMDRKLPPRAVNARLCPELRVLAIREVPGHFHPRYDALHRTYRYFLYDEGFDLGAIREACRLLEGEHSFHNFTRARGKNYTRRLLSVTAERRGEVVVLTFKGESFLWEMVRRLTSAIAMVGRGELSLEALEEALLPGVERKFPAAPPQFLVLWEVAYDFEFEHEEYTAGKLSQQLEERFAALCAQAAIAGAMSAELRG
ncbi:MAG: tRNA pseudouridine(38-40) synthase TruA [Euryarchaeota archaeon]|nr:tRNA pseudouridine(38-40) synthase TruA [Euryarchaeota archaeon]